MLSRPVFLMFILAALLVFNPGVALAAETGVSPSSLWSAWSASFLAGASAPAPSFWHPLLVSLKNLFPLVFANSNECSPNQCWNINQTRPCVWTGQFWHWGEPIQTCPSGTQCQNGQCVGSGGGGGCTNECTPGQCWNSGQTRECKTNFDSDPCYDWGPTVYNCPAGTQCPTTCSPYYTGEGTHAECRGGQCVIAQGGGPDQNGCDKNHIGAACAGGGWHSECRIGECAPVNGAGNDQCKTNADCFNPAGAPQVELTVAYGAGPGASSITFPKPGVDTEPPYKFWIYMNPNPNIYWALDYCNTYGWWGGLTYGSRILIPYEVYQTARFGIVCHYHLNPPGTGDANSKAEATVYVTSPPSSPTVDIKANGSDGPITVSSGSSATLSWTSTQANACTASGGWSGSKSTSGTQLIGPLTNAAAYTITCTGSGGSAVDSVIINISGSGGGGTRDSSGGGGTRDTGGTRGTGGTGGPAGTGGGPTYQCSDGLDNDGDKKIDYPADPGCTSPTDNNEFNLPKIKEILPSLFFNWPSSNKNRS
jgi:hypothetical protein